MMAGVSRRSRPEIVEEELACTGLVRRVMDLRGLIWPSEAMHGNTQLQLFDALVVLLAAFFNPMVRSLRLIEQLSQMQWVQRAGLEKNRICRSTLSDAFERFDPEQLRPLIQALVGQVPNLGRIDKDLEGLCKQIIAADGSMFTLMSETAWALHHTKPNGKKQAQCRLDVQLDIDRFSPVDVSLAGDAQGSEAGALTGRIRPNVIYLIDRNFVHFGCLNAILERGSSFVLRLKKSTTFTVERELALTARDVEAGVVHDRIGQLGSSNSRRGAGTHGRSSGTRTTAPPDQLLREVIIVDPKTGQPIRLLSDLLDVPAFVIGLLYRCRWQVELFLRWLKVWAGMEHLVSCSRKGITLQFYAAAIACLLMHIRNGRRVNKYMLFLMGQVASGLATFEQILPMLERIEREKELEKLRRVRKKSLPKTPSMLPG
jgi:hypothetical protein